MLVKRITSRHRSATDLLSDSSWDLSSLWINELFERVVYANDKAGLIIIIYDITGDKKYTFLIGKKQEQLKL